MGGTVAYEMAHQLRERGDAVAFLGLLDQGSRPHDWTRGLPLPSLAADLPAVLRDIGDGDGDRLTKLVNHPRVAHVLATYPDQARARRLLELTLRNERAVRRYVPPPTALRVSLFRAADSAPADGDAGGPDLGWTSLARGGVDVETVSGHHFTMLRFPHVRMLAERLTAALQRASEAYYRGDAREEGRRP
jgi:thioesterase domain-containing protein